jgi:hypothetical protein
MVLPPWTTLTYTFPALLLLPFHSLSTGAEPSENRSPNAARYHDYVFAELDGRN